MNSKKEYCTKEGKWIPAVKVGDPGDWGEHEKDTYYCPDCTAGKGGNNDGFPARKRSLQRFGIIRPRY